MADSRIVFKTDVLDVRHVNGHVLLYVWPKDTNRASNVMVKMTPDEATTFAAALVKAREPGRRQQRVV